MARPSLRLSHRILLVPVLFVAAITVLVGYTSTTLAGQKSVGLVINLAGRQRMLNQRYAKEVLLNCGGVEVDPSGTLAVLKKSASALERGGEAPLGKGKTATLPAAPTQELEKLLRDQRDGIEQLEAAGNACLAAASEGDQEALEQRQEELLAVTSSLHTVANNAVTAFQQNGSAKIATMQNNQILLGAIAAILGSLVAFTCARWILRTLEDVKRVMEAMGEGNLTDRADEGAGADMGELAGCINDFQTRLANDLQSVRAASGAIDMNSGGLREASSSLAAASTEQSASLQSVTTNVDSVRSLAAANAERAQEANNLSSQTTSEAEDGSRRVEELLEAMASIEDSSSQISNIIRVIDEIAFQTNLLALNAAVESARAGDAGKGFAVVAEEVRALALRSAEAARDTGKLIEESSQRAARSSSIASSVSEALGTILNGTRKVNTLLGEIASASAEQDQGTGHLYRSIEEMNHVTSKNADGAMRLYESAQDTSERAGELRGLVSRFALTNEETSPAGETAEAF